MTATASRIEMGTFVGEGSDGPSHDREVRETR